MEIWKFKVINFDTNPFFRYLNNQIRIVYWLFKMDDSFELNQLIFGNEKTRYRLKKFHLQKL